MSSVLIRERNNASPAIVMPLTAPSVEAAWSFLSWLVPPTVFSSGSGRRRRRGEEPWPLGQRSDQGYLLFYRSSGGQVTQQPLKSPRSIQAYLRQQVSGTQADHWVATQITQYRAQRDGRDPSEGWTTATARHILGLVVDLDGARMASPYRYLLENNFYALLATLDDRMGALGIAEYRVTRSGPEGLHLYVPLVRPDGKPLRATESNMATWERVARALARFLADMGADSNAVRAVQPFAVPGLPRAKHPGFVPYVAGGRDGARADLYALLRRLSALKQVMAKERVSLPPAASEPTAVLQAILTDIRERAAGVNWGTRNQVAHDIATYLLAKGAKDKETWDALQVWNRRNGPSLSTRELRRCLRSADRCEGRYPGKWQQMQTAPWARLRGVLGLPADRPARYLSRGRWRPLTPAKSWEERKLNGGREHYHEIEERILSHLQAQDGRWEVTQGEIADLLGIALSSLKEVLKRLVAAGRVEVLTKRGRGGRTVLVAQASHASEVDVNSQSRLSSVAVKTGAWVGQPVFEGGLQNDNKQDGAVNGVQLAVAPRDPLFLAAEILRTRGVQVVSDLDWMVMWDGAERCVLAAREPGDTLLQWFADGGYSEELGSRLGGIRVEVRVRRWRPGFAMQDWLASGDEDTDDPEEDPPPW